MTSEQNNDANSLCPFTQRPVDIEMHLLVVFNNPGNPIFVKNAEGRLLLVPQPACCELGLTQPRIISGP